ncbi:hypothetical protein B566_EDAN001602 [Ephemera danica]|nr:hypothetical protein B566_EDAN001602 [Ephemera danica]
MLYFPSAEYNWHTVAGRVLILPEKILPYLPNECRSRCHSRIPNAQKRSLHHAALTPWPSWVYQQYDETLLVKKMKKEMNAMCNAPSRSSKESGAVQSLLVTPDCPVALSFWVAQSLPLVDIQRVSLLQINSSIQRLRWELSFLSQCRWLCCQVCGSQLASTEDTFCMSVEGPQGTYVNPSGFVHETMTVKKAKNVVMIGGASGDYSWFPGYSWTIAQCSSCNTHVGWLFTSTKLSPPMFFGLSRSAIITLTLTCNKGGQFRTIM